MLRTNFWNGACAWNIIYALIIVEWWTVGG